MSASQELFSIADRLQGAADSPIKGEYQAILSALRKSCDDAERAFSGSWLGYHAYVYYKDLAPPPAGVHFSQEWGLKDLPLSTLGSKGQWQEFDPSELEKLLRERAGGADLATLKAASVKAENVFTECQAEIESILRTECKNIDDKFLENLIDELDRINILDESDVIDLWTPKGQIMTRDSIAIGQGLKAPPHITIRANICAIENPFDCCAATSIIARKAASHLERLSKKQNMSTRIGTNVFIGHGRSLMWRELKDFVQDRLRLPWDEFNRVPVAGVTNQARLSEMLDSAAVALVIMTAEDETAEGQMHARMNVIHEVGLFQGRLGFTKAVILLENGCEEFTNIQGVGQIRFPAGNISAAFEEVRRVLEREGLLES